MVKKTRAFITGITGQDGTHLSKYLVGKGVEVYGGFRRGSHHKTWRLDEAKLTNKIKIVEAQLGEPLNLVKILSDVKPDIIFHLAGVSFISDSFNYPASAVEFNTIGSINILEACRISCPEAKIFFASSSEIFGGKASENILTESSFPSPQNPYGVSKLAANQIVKIYRESYEMQCCSGILFNHEGPYRSRQFVTRKISFNIAKQKLLGGPPIELGNLASARDWGSAEDYTIGMYKLLKNSKLEDVIFATGRLTNVKDFLSITAKEAGFQPVFEGEGIREKCIDRISGKELAKVSKKYFRPFDTVGIAGDSSRLTEITGWKSRKSVEEIAVEMLKADLDRIKKGRVDV